MDNSAATKLCIYHGPAFVGKHLFFQRVHSRTHKAVYPEILYEENPDTGIRDIALMVVKLLKKGTKVVILDLNECRKTRESYLKLIKTKCPGTSASIVSILPKYGCLQLFWSREMTLACEADNSCQAGKGSLPCTVDDGGLLKWFSSETDTTITYSHGNVDRPSEEEGCKVYEHVLGIYTTSVYKFEVPAMFLQWECLEKSTFIKAACKVLEEWTSVNTSGRVIIICDGSQIVTGEKSRRQQIAEIDEVLKSLTQHFQSCPVYVFHLCDVKVAGSYVVPPRPGILAYLQRRHCLNLHSKRTLYLYETSSHMRMAEHAGIKHIQASRAFKHQAVVTSPHLAVTPAIPDMLKDVKILPVESSTDQPQIPLYDQVDQFQDGRIVQRLAHGRAEYLYAKDIDSIRRFQDNYSKHATKVGEQGSKISTKKSPSKQPSVLPEELTPGHNTSTLGQAKGYVSTRDLPKWMMKKEDSSVSVSLLDRSDSTNSTSSSARKTVYIMTEKELLETACDILKQAGKHYLVDQYLQCSDQGELKPNKDDQTPKRSMKHQRKKSTTRQKGQQTNKGIGEQLGSFCPKIEPSDKEEQDDDDDGDDFWEDNDNKNVNDDKCDSFLRNDNDVGDNINKASQDDLDNDDAHDDNDDGDDDSNSDIDDNRDCDKIEGDVCENRKSCFVENKTAAGSDRTKLTSKYTKLRTEVTAQRNKCYNRSRQDLDVEGKGICDGIRNTNDSDDIKNLRTDMKMCRREKLHGSPTKSTSMKSAALTSDEDLKGTIFDFITRDDVKKPSPRKRAINEAITSADSDASTRKQSRMLNADDPKPGTSSKPGPSGRQKPTTRDYSFLDEVF